MYSRIRVYNFFYNPNLFKGMEAQKMLCKMIAVVTRMFQGKIRKDIEKTPMIAHLLETMVIVGFTTQNPIVLMAALLHDALEDIPRAEATLREVFQKPEELEMLDQVLSLVRECSENKDPAKPNEKLPWRERKEEHVGRMKDASLEALMIILADKISNLRVETVSGGEGFNSTPRERIWYYEEILLIVEKRSNTLVLNSLRQEMVRLFDEFHKAVEQSEA